MFKNHITTAIRNLRKNKLFALINIGGLAIGLAAVILIGLFVRDELGYDRWLPDVERLYKLQVSFHAPGAEPQVFAQTPGPAAPALEKDFPEIEETVRILDATVTVRQGARSFNERVSFVDDSFFRLFDLPVAAGDRQAALDNNTSLAISQDMAQKYFGDGPALGQTLTLDGTTDYTVVGVFKNIPDNTHFDSDFIALLDPARYDSSPRSIHNWVYIAFHTYIKLQDGAEPAGIRAGFQDYIARNFSMATPSPGFDPVTMTKFSLIPVANIHLYADRDGHQKPGGDIVTVLTFTAVAVLILVIAGINFINLSTAQAMKRAREVSMRKVLGASRGQLIAQFLGEAFLISLVALGLAAGLAELALPFYNEFLDKQLTMDYFSDPALSFGMLSVAALVALLGGGLSGLFPVRLSAVVGAAFQSVVAVRGPVAAQCPGHLSVCRLHRPDRRHRRHLWPDDLRPQL